MRTVVRFGLPVRVRIGLPAVAMPALVCLVVFGSSGGRPVAVLALAASIPGAVFLGRAGTTLTADGIDVRGLARSVISVPWRGIAGVDIEREGVGRDEREIAVLALRDGRKVRLVGMGRPLRPSLAVRLLRGTADTDQAVAMNVAVVRERVAVESAVPAEAADAE